MECQLISVGSQLAPARQACKQPASPAPTTNLQPKATSQLEARGWKLVAEDWRRVAGNWWLGTVKQWIIFGSQLIRSQLTIDKLTIDNL